MPKQKPRAKDPARTVAYRGKIIEMDINKSIKTGPLVEVFLLKTGKSQHKKVQLRELVHRELFYMCTLFYVFEIFGRFVILYGIRMHFHEHLPRHLLHWSQLENNYCRTFGLKSKFRPKFDFGQTLKCLPKVEILSNV